MLRNLIFNICIYIPVFIYVCDYIVIETSPTDNTVATPASIGFYLLYTHSLDKRCKKKS